MLSVFDLWRYYFPKVKELEHYIAKLEQEKADIKKAHDCEVQFAYDALGKATSQNTGLLEGFGLLQEDYKRSIGSRDLTIACLLAQSGDEAFLSKDLIQSVSNDNWTVDYGNDSPDGCLIKLVSKPIEDTEGD